MLCAGIITCGCHR